MPARGVDILEILPVTFAADRAKAFLHHHFGKADDSIERCANFVADLGKKLGLRCGCLLGRDPGVDQFIFAALPGGDVAHYRAKLLAILDAPDRDMQRNKAALAHAADCFVAGIERIDAVAPGRPLEMLEHQVVVDDSRVVRSEGDTAVVTAKLWLKGTRSTGKAFDYTVWFSDTYVRTPKGWIYVFGQSSLRLPKSSQ